HIQGGNVKAIALLDRVRSPALPDLATAHEQGLRDFAANNWIGLFLPRNVPESIVGRLRDATVKAMNTPEVRARMQATGTNVVDESRTSPEYLKSFVVSEIEKWAGPIKASGISAD